MQKFVLCAERMKKFSLSTMPGGLKGTVFQKNQMGDYMLA
jgi:hypothetical protein